MTHLETIQAVLEELEQEPQTPHLHVAIGGLRTALDQLPHHERQVAESKAAAKALVQDAAPDTEA